MIHILFFLSLLTFLEMTKAKLGKVIPYGKLRASVVEIADEQVFIFFDLCCRLFLFMKRRLS